MIVINNSVRKIFGGVIAGVGFLLSPLSWWNDILVNIPLAYLIASGITFLIPGYFSMFMILAYWLTNVLGLMLMHGGGSLLFSSQIPQSYTLKSVVKELSISMIYSLLIAILVIADILKLPTEYFK